jgi:hypothetical protein
MVAGVARAQRLEPIDEVEVAGRDIVQITFTPLYQYATDAAEDTGSYELDLFGSLKVVDRRAGSTGDGRIVFWALAQDNLGNLQPASEMAAKAGLLWPTNDVVVSGSTANVPLLAWAQRFADDRLRVWAGKMWPQLFFVRQKLAGDNPAGFMSRLISNDMAARYYDLTGLGVFAEYSGRRWFVRGSFVDAQAESELDVSSFVESRWAWVAEGGRRFERHGGTTTLSALVSAVDDTDDVEGETAHSLAFSHDLVRSRHRAVHRSRIAAPCSPNRSTGASSWPGRGTDPSDRIASSSPPPSCMENRSSSRMPSASTSSTGSSSFGKSASVDGSRSPPTSSSSSIAKTSSKPYRG